MAASRSGTLRCVVVTPETTVVDEEAQFVAFPVFDGEIGVAPKHAPLVARVGCGELRMRTAEKNQRYYIDGGFAQVHDDVLTILTSRAKQVSDLDPAELGGQLAAVSAEKAVGDEAIQSKMEKQLRLRKQLGLARRR